MSYLAELWRTRRTLLLAVCLVAGLGLVIALVWPITDLIAAHDLGTVSGAVRATHLQDAREAVRTQLLTLGAGLFAAGALFYTARNFALSRQQMELSRQQFTEQLELSRHTAQDSAEAERRTLELTEQGQVTDRYTKAIEQLGSDKLDVRIGGIYALERIARDSARDHPTVMEVLSAFIREHSREQWPMSAAGEATEPRSLRPDLQAALSVIGRRESDSDAPSIDLAGADLTGAYLANANLANANLTKANLVGAYLQGASLMANLDHANLADTFLRRSDLTGAYLVGANLANANLFAAKLIRANLAGADLTSADLRAADLNSAYVTEANLTDANLMGAKLMAADLIGANIAGANFEGADLTSTRWPKKQSPPQGWRRTDVADELKPDERNPPPPFNLIRLLGP